MRAQLAIGAITAAHASGLVAGNAIMHADRGSEGGFNWWSQHLD
jgi:putative transposase